MKLTPQESKMVQKLQKQERHWPRSRWIFLSIGVLTTFNTFLFGYASISTAQNGNVGHPNVLDAMDVAIFFPKCMIYAGLTAFLFVKAITDWHGNPNRRLLLKLLEAQQESQAGGNP